MRPVSNNHIQNIVTHTPQKTSGQSSAMPHPVKPPLRSSPGILPEDVVTLTKERSANLSLNKGPSAAVSAPESRALRDSFSTYA